MWTSPETYILRHEWMNPNLFSHCWLTWSQRKTLRGSLQNEPPRNVKLKERLVNFWTDPSEEATDSRQQTTYSRQQTADNRQGRRPQALLARQHLGAFPSLSNGVFSSFVSAYESSPAKGGKYLKVWSQTHDWALSEARKLWADVNLTKWHHSPEYFRAKCNRRLKWRTHSACEYSL